MSTLTTLLSQYTIITTLCTHLSTLDLLSLTLTNSTNHSFIAQSALSFNVLKRQALCDGHGLLERQEMKGIYDPKPWRGSRRASHTADQDEEVEVRLYNLRCDEGNALPCGKCGVNVCEECRFVPRVRDAGGWASRTYPHLDPAFQSHTVRCYCSRCDLEVEKSLPLSLSEFCTCTQYTRWICLPCKLREYRDDRWYYTKRTRQEYYDETTSEEDGEGNRREVEVVPIRQLHDHQFSRAFWCPCGARTKQSANVRCAWCKRRHAVDPSEDTRSRDTIPFFDDDPCYPKYVAPWRAANAPPGYPVLGYKGPIAP